MTSHGSSKSTSALPMQLRVGDRLTDERGEWEVASRPTTMVGGKTVHAKIRKLDEPAVTEHPSWSAYERVAVTRA